MKIIALIGLVLVSFLTSAFDAIEVTDVAARQRYPWNGLVDVKVAARVAEGAGSEILTGCNKVLLSVQDGAEGTNIAVKTLTYQGAAVENGSFGLKSSGTNSIIWNAGADLPDGFVSSNLTLRADVAPYTYRVRFHANGGTGTMQDESFTYGVERSLTANAFTRSHYNFRGWSTTPKGTVEYNDQASVKNLMKTDEGIVDLYAVWEFPVQFLVIDLSAGSSASRYPVSYVNSGSAASFNTDEYKTTKLVLKCLPDGTFKMQNEGVVTLTKPFYMGLFEVTQKQYQLVMGTNPSHFTGDMRPVEYVSYNMIRGTSLGAQWPTSNAVDGDSFLGKLRARTGLDFDLPTEAQWEYACRAGTTTTYSYGDGVDGSYMWYYDNSDSQTHKVGTRKPNPWGLYDMHGNVWEWCLDWYNDSLSYGVDPRGPSSGSYRVDRGGSWLGDASRCPSAYRGSYCAPLYVLDTRGFRLVRTLP
ncbi:MAG: SUMF1/EgtB/PvdO family nonheme iron enzyme [Kiritimatiellia bacterium]